MAKSKKAQQYTAQEIAAFKKEALQLYRQDEGNAVALGHALLKVRIALRGQHGAFKKWWQENKLSQARVSYCMRKVNGKAAAAKAKAQASYLAVAKAAQAAVNKKLNRLFKTCAIGTADNLSKMNVENDLVSAVGETFKQVASFTGWQFSAPHVFRPMHEYTKALHSLIRALQNPPRKKPVKVASKPLPAALFPGLTAQAETAAHATA